MMNMIMIVNNENDHENIDDNPMIFYFPLVL